DLEGQAESGVRLKYETQAPFYAGAEGTDIEESLRLWILREIPKGRRILVAGSGTGRECFALARQGYEVSGVDFSPAMVDRARQEAQRLGLPVQFHAADLRAHRAPAASLGAVIFTYEVYSFLPRTAQRIRLLSDMRAWLEPGGKIFLSARRRRGLYE